MLMSSGVLESIVLANKASYRTSQTLSTRIVWIYMYLMGNYKTHIERQTIEWPKEERQKMIYKTLYRKLKNDLQSTIQKAKDWTTRIP